MAPTHGRPRPLLLEGDRWHHAAYDPEHKLVPAVVPGARVGEDAESVCSRTINTSFMERQHATDRGRNARKSRRTYRFSKAWEVHESNPAVAWSGCADNSPGSPP